MVKFWFALSCPSHREFNWNIWIILCNERVCGYLSCLSLCEPVMDWRPVQGVPRLSPDDRWDRLQPPRDPTDELSGRKWMDGYYAMMESLNYLHVYKQKPCSSIVNLFAHMAFHWVMKLFPYFFLKDATCLGWSFFRANHFSDLFQVNLVSCEMFHYMFLFLLTFFSFSAFNL